MLGSQRFYHPVVVGSNKTFDLNPQLFTQFIHQRL